MAAGSEEGLSLCVEPSQKTSRSRLRTFLDQPVLLRP